MKAIDFGCIVLFLVAACSPGEDESKGDQGAAPASISETGVILEGAVAKAARDEPSHAGNAVQAEPVLCAGAEFHVIRTVGVKGNLRPQGGMQAFPLNFFQQLEYTDQVEEVKGRRICATVRSIRKAESRNMDPETRRIDTKPLARSGQVYRVEHSDSGTTLHDPSSGNRIRNEELVEAFARETAPALWPEGCLSKGQRWSYSGTDLANRIGLLDIRGGQIDLRVERIDAEPTTDLETAYIRGSLDTRIDLDDGLMANFKAKVEIDLPLAIGVPFMIKFEGRLSGQGTVQDDWGQPLNLGIDGEGSVLHVCKPSEAVLDAAGAADVGPAAAREENRSGAVPATRTDTKKHEKSRGQSARGSGMGTVRFQLTAEPKEKAFSLLIPAGWHVEGGILRIDPTAQGGAAQSIEAKLDFAVKRDASGTVMIRWTPELMYKDARNMPARQMGMFPDGSNYMGMTVWPLVSSKEYLQKILFPKAHPHARDVRINEVKDLPELAGAFQAALNAILPGTGFTYDASLMTVTYTEQGTRFKEQLVTAVESWGSLDAWKNKTTFFLRAPADEFERWEPIFSVIMRSVVLNVQWAVGEVQGQIKRGEIASKTYEEIQRIGREIADHHQKTNAEIHNDMFLTLTDQEEYVNPFTNEVQTGSNQWDHLWIHESGEVIYTDDESFDPNTDPDMNLSGFKRARIR